MNNSWHYVEIAVLVGGQLLVTFKPSSRSFKEQIYAQEHPLYSGIPVAGAVGMGNRPLFEKWLPLW